MSVSSEPATPSATRNSLRQMELREWGLWASAIVVTLLLTIGIASFLIPLLHAQFDAFYSLHLNLAVRGLLGSVLLFDVYTIYQQLQIHQVRRRLAYQDELFRLISEHAADMIALVDMKGTRLYNSPAYQRILGYTADELGTTSAFEQIHPEDQHRVLEAAAEARRTGVGRTVEYRMRHKDGTWRVLESTASVVADRKGKPEKMVIVNRDITARRSAEERLVHNTFHDALTNLPNRALLLDRVQRAFSHAKRHPEYRFALLFIDIDDFKKFNDTFGHAIGDEVIIEIARRLLVSLRHDDTISRLTSEAAGDDTLARLGGDEFAVLLYDIKDPSDAIRVANRVQDVFAVPFSFNNQQVFTAASIGIALSTTPHDRAEDLLRDADIAMHRAKALGKARCEVFDTEMHARAVNRLKLETDLRRAIEQREFRNYYQPIISLRTGRITGFEALVRWQNGEKLVMPGDFIRVAEDTGLIIQMNRLLLPEACRKVHAWQMQYPSKPPLVINSNVSSKEFAQPDLVSNVARVLEETSLAPQNLQLEITETVAMSDADKASYVLSQLKSLGVRIAIDDFGTGYSSLSRLQGFPVDTLKIDRSFIARMQSDADSREIVRTIVMLGHHFGMKVVAEGAETAGQVESLKELGCEFVQGYFFSKPVDENVAEKLLVDDRRSASPHAATLSIARS